MSFNRCANSQTGDIISNSVTRGNSSRADSICEEFSTTASFEGGGIATALYTSDKNVTITGNITNNIPSDTELNVSYPISYTFTNHSGTTATELSIDTSSMPNDFNLVSNTCSNILNPSGTCTVEGNFRGTIVGIQNLSLTLRYKEGPDIILDTQTNVSEVAVSGSVTTDLPENTELDTTYPVTFTLTNDNNHHAATGVSITNNSSSIFSITNDTCTNEIAAGSTCVVSGDFNATAIGQNQVSITLSYDQGNDVQVSTRNTTVTDVAVQGSVTTDLPEITELDTTYPVTFTFTNDNNHHAATGVSITNNSSSIFSITNDTCTNEITAGGTCVVSGDFNATAIGQSQVSITLSYDQGGDINLSSRQTDVTDLILTWVSSPELPNNTRPNTNYPLTFTLENTNVSHTANGLSIDLQGLTNDFNITSNNCNSSTLAPNSSCSISGNFNSSITGTKNISLSASYNEGDDATISVQTNVSSVAIDGTVSPTGTTNTLPNRDLSVVFIFTNISTTNAATGVSLIKNLPNFTESSDNCGQTIQPNSSCQIGGIFNSGTTGTQTLSVKLSYDEGDDVDLEKQINVNNVPIVGTFAAHSNSLLVWKSMISRVRMGLLFL